MNPKKFGKLDNHDQEPWKLPLGQFVEECYRKPNSAAYRRPCSASKSESPGRKSRRRRHDAKPKPKNGRRSPTTTTSCSPRKASSTTFPPTFPRSYSPRSFGPMTFGSSGSFPMARSLPPVSGTPRTTMSGCSSSKEVPRCNSRAVPMPSNCGAAHCLNIPARARHRVSWTDPDQKTIWLAIHYRTESF